ncbi:MAG: DUF58 domain-containing protein [Cellvibrionaceae bacterium]|nr:DUF58 domain-containing protein [Cellvibrionaceae bacterium]
MYDLWRRCHQRWQQWQRAWLRGRTAPHQRQRLSHRTIFIMPSKTGLGFLVLIILLWLLGTNYQNNLVLGMAFLLLSVLLICILHTYANLSGLIVQVLHTEPGFVGGSGRIQLLISSDNKRYYESIYCYCDKNHGVSCSLLAKRSCELSLNVPLTRRGWWRLQRLRIETTFPLGVFYAWSTLDMDLALLAYPQPISATYSTVHELSDDCEAGQSMPFLPATDEFSGLRDYQSGDALKCIAWRSLARGQGLATKLYDDTARDALWLDWKAFPGLGPEQRLSRLCAAVLSLATSNDDYGLRLPGVDIAPAQGEAHRLRVLEALALFECGT